MSILLQLAENLCLLISLVGIGVVAIPTVISAAFVERSTKSASTKELNIPIICLRIAYLIPLWKNNCCRPGFSSLSVASYLAQAGNQVKFENDSPVDVHVNLKDGFTLILGHRVLMPDVFDSILVTSKKVSDYYQLEKLIELWSLLRQSKLNQNRR